MRVSAPNLFSTKTEMVCRIFNFGLAAPLPWACPVDSRALPNQARKNQKPASHSERRATCELIESKPRAASSNDAYQHDHDQPIHRARRVAPPRNAGQ